MDEITTTVTSTGEPASGEATVFAFAPEVDDAPEAQFTETPVETDVTEDTQPESADQVENPVSDEGAIDPQQDKIGKAFAAQKRDLESKYRKEYADKEALLKADPAFAIGNRMIADAMKSGKTREEAIETINDRMVSAWAKREGVSPAVAKMLLELETVPVATTPKVEEVPDVEAQAKNIVDEIMQMELPEGFDMEAAFADDAFVKLVTDYSPKAAVRIYMAEQKAASAEKNAPQAIAEQLRARQAIPQASKPQAAAAPAVDFNTMSSEDFWAFKERRQRNM